MTGRRQRNLQRRRLLPQQRLLQPPRRGLCAHCVRDGACGGPGREAVHQRLQVCLSLYEAVLMTAWTRRATPRRSRWPAMCRRG